MGINLTHCVLERYPLADKSGSLSCAPMFIISSGRSGTTLMRSMLVASGNVAIPAETQIIHALAVKFPLLFGLGWEGLTRAIIADFESHPNFPLWESNLTTAYRKTADLPRKERSLARIIDEVYMTYASEKFPNAKLWGDQSPIHTFALPYIHKVFPNARYMHLLRDGRDVVSSMVKRHGDDYLYEAVYRWKTSIKRINAFIKKIPPEQYLEVRYEDLVQHPEDTLIRVSRFLGIEYTSKMLDYWKLPSTIEHKYKTFHVNLGKPVFPTSIGKWKERLNEEQQSYILKQITPELKSLGYLN
ncbi:MAG: sulfotransferase [Anaerolineaceae bacterium]|nr:sulfotransferase [Anaerolineaceae bacterium]